MESDNNSILKSNNTFYLNTPIGIIKISSKKHRIVKIEFTNTINHEHKQQDNKHYQEISNYFFKFQPKFTIPYFFSGTVFQKKVWKALTKIPFGQTTTYSSIAKSTGFPKAIRAVGQAIKKNPIPIIIPCHRVISMNGELTGYAHDLWRKKWLLEHEKKLINKNRTK